MNDDLWRRLLILLMTQRDMSEITLPAGALGCIPPQAVTLSPINGGGIRVVLDYSLLDMDIPQA